MYGFIEKVHVIEMLVADLGEGPGGPAPLSEGLDDRPPLISRSGFGSEYNTKLHIFLPKMLRIVVVAAENSELWRFDLGFTFNIYLSVYQRDFFSLIYKNSSYYYDNKSIFHITIHFLLIQTS